MTMNPQRMKVLQIAIPQEFKIIWEAVCCIRISHIYQKQEGKE